MDDERSEALRPAGDPQVERHQRVREKQILTALAVYVSALIPFAYINHLGMLNLTTDMKIAGVLAALMTNAIFLLLIRTRINLMFKDPSMTLAQVLIASGFATLSAWSMDQPARIFALTLFLLAFLFGIYTLKVRQFLFLTLMVVLGYSSVVVREYVLSNGGRSFRIELMNALVLTTSLVWMSLVGGYVSTLRRRLAAQRRELAAVAFIDPLTDLHNRRYVTEALERELARIQRSKVKTLSIALLDIDHFKQVNDRFGHATGDQTLVELAEILKGEMRLMDTVGRFGGEEFIVLMPDTNERGAEVAMSRLRRRVEATPGPARGVTLTVSIGITEFREGDTVEKMLRRADEAMYSAKRAGRNQLQRASDLD
ncbi:MAG: GGDEF domain-containing protein [Gammaproteobacteria bacterium]|nr:GGDEF domain-containing protein [Gammaproteobacteria bacterium]